EPGGQHPHQDRHHAPSSTQPHPLSLQDEAAASGPLLPSKFIIGAGRGMPAPPGRTARPLWGFHRPHLFIALHVFMSIIGPYGRCRSGVFWKSSSLHPPLIPPFPI